MFSPRIRAGYSSVVEDRHRRVGDWFGVDAVRLGGSSCRRPEVLVLMPRKPASKVYDGPPGDIRLEVRVNDRIVFLQRVHGYHIDQQADQVLVTGAMRPVEAAPVAPVVESPVVPDDAA